MFEAAEVGERVEKPAFKEEAKRLRGELLEAQRQLAGSKFSLAVVVGGVEGAGKSEVVNLLLEWMDSRGIEVHAFGEPSDEERERPRFWRYWRLLPARSRMGVFFGSWYSQPIVERVFKAIGREQFEVELDRIVEFERMLSRENVVLVKLWMHLSKKQQKKRLRALAKDPDTAWRVTPMEWKFFKKYDRFRKVSEEALGHTDTEYAPWTIVEATDWRYRDLAVARQVLKAMRDKLAAVAANPAPPRVPDNPKPKKVNVLSRLDLGRKLDKRAFDEQLEHWQGRLNRLSRRLHQQKRSVILVFEGPDAAGKGGAIRRVTQAIDARGYQVISVAAPTDEERGHPYLWRFWRRLPRLGRMSIYDRSWYGRVLVERLEGFCYPEDWKRAYGEINAFESQLADAGTIVLKFWIQISPEEELRRFQDRQKTPYKQYKITEEDWRNRDKWDGYQAAACEMIEKTSTPHAPWVLIEGDDKPWARIKILKTLCARLEKALGTP